MFAKPQPSVFTAAVVAGLRTGAADRDRDGEVTVDELYDYVYDSVREQTPSQTPEKGGETRGKLIVAWSPHAKLPSAEPAAAPEGAPPARRPRRMPVAIAVAAAGMLLAGAGVGTWLGLDHAGSPHNTVPPQHAGPPLIVNTCARASPGTAAPVELGSMQVGRAGSNRDFIGATFSPDCQVLATSGNGTAQVWNMVTGHKISILPVNPGGWAFSAVFTPDGKTIAVAAGNGTTTVWDVTTGDRKDTLDSDHVKGGSTFAIVLSLDGTRLFTGGNTYVVREWNLARSANLANQAPLREIPVPSIGSLALSPDGKTLGVAGADGTERLFDLASGQQVVSLPGHQGNTFAMAFSPDGKILAAGTTSGGVQWWDLTDHKLIAQGIGEVTDVAFSPDGKILAAGSYDAVALWDVSTHQLITTLPVGNAGDYVTGLAFSRYGGILAVGYNGTLELWNVAGV
jgi:WD40 repeat protein